MKKLNEKGLTIVELLVCFVIVAVVAITLLNTLMEYKNEEQIENIKNHVESYKNTVTRVIQSDVTDHALVGYEKGERTNSEYSATLVFDKPFMDGSTKKTLTIHVSDTENYIQYPDVAKKEDGSYEMQDVRYYLDATGTILDVDINEPDSNKKTAKNDLRFYNINENTIRVNGHTITIDIPITHSELDTYHIKIVAPIGLLSSVKEKEVDECTLVYSMENNQCNPAAVTIQLGQSWGNNLCVPENKTGYNFKEWRTGSSCSGEKASELICEKERATQYVYPCWDAKTTRLILHYEMGTYTGATTRTMTYGKNTNNNIGKVTPPTGYTFQGWRISGGQTVYDEQGKNYYNPTYWTAAYPNGTWRYNGERLDLYAMIEGKKTTITLDDNGATTKVSPTTITATYGSSTISPASLTTLPEKKYTVTLQNTGSTSTRKTNKLSFTTRKLNSTYTFGGWSMAPRQSFSAAPKVLNNAKSLAFEKNVSNFTSSTGTWISQNASTTVHAIWTGGAVTLPTVTQTGYTCGFTDSDTGTTIKYTGSYTPTSNTTLYPVCVPNTHYLTYNLNGKSGSCNPNPKTGKYGSAWGTLCSLSKSGDYYFLDWRDSGNTNTTISSTTKVTGNKTAKANWYKCEPVGNWTNEATNIRIYASFLSTAHYRKSSNTSYSALTISSGSNTTPAQKHYKYYYYLNQNKVIECDSKYDGKKPYAPYRNVELGEAAHENLRVDSFKCLKGTATLNGGSYNMKTGGDQANTITCTIKYKILTAGTGVISYSYHYNDQPSDESNGKIGIRYEIEKKTFSDGTSCTGKYDRETQTHLSECPSTIPKSSEYYGIDYAGNTGYKLYFNYEHSD